MKESKFNIFYNLKSDDSKVIAYNSRSNALAIMKKVDFEKLKKFSVNEDLKLDTNLIEDNLDEFKLLRHETQTARYNSKALALTIAPTLGCNFGCVYCYEKEHTNYEKMTSETQNEIISYISRECNTY